MSILDCLLLEKALVMLFVCVGILTFQITEKICFLENIIPIVLISISIISSSLCMAINHANNIAHLI